MSNSSSRSAPASALPHGPELLDTEALNQVLDLPALNYKIDSPIGGGRPNFVTILIPATTPIESLTADRLKAAAAQCGTRHVAIEIVPPPGSSLAAERVAITSSELDPAAARAQFPHLSVGPCYTKLWPRRLADALDKMRQPVPAL